MGREEYLMGKYKEIVGRQKEKKMRSIKIPPLRVLIPLKLQIICIM
jgi:hypothetical protein